jgi:hypothetical protein
MVAVLLDLAPRLVPATQKTLTFPGGLPGFAQGQRIARQI